MIKIRSVESMGKGQSIPGRDKKIGWPSRFRIQNAQSPRNGKSFSQCRKALFKKKFEARRGEK